MFPFGSRQAPPPQLPRPIPPLHGETTKSYLYRLTVANQLHPDDLRAHLIGARSHTPVTVESLAAATGRSAHALRYALPELRTSAPGADPSIPGHIRRTVCRHCAARRDIFPFAIVWQPVEMTVCTAHLIWLGPPGDRRHHGPQYYIGDLPEIRHAQQEHRKLARRHGREATAEAVAEAAHITALWARRGYYLDRRAPLIQTLLGSAPLTGKLPSGHPVTSIVTYPETVGLARVLVTPRWRYPANRLTKREISQFRREISHHLGIRYDPGDNGYDPLFRWFQKHHHVTCHRSGS